MLVFLGVSNIKAVDFLFIPTLALERKSSIGS